MTTRRVAGVLGLFATIGIMVANSLGPVADQPGYGAAPSEWGRWLAEHPLSTSDWGVAYFEVIVLCAFLVFFSALWGVLRRAEGEWSWLATAALGAGLVSTTVKLASGPIAIVAFDRNDGLSPDVQTALIESNGWSFVLTFAIDGVFLLCTGALIVATRVLPRWLGWFAIPLGVLCLLSVLGGYEGFPGILLFFLWVIVTSVYLIVRPGSPEVAT
jgi:hypothetical protein